MGRDMNVNHFILKGNSQQSPRKQSSAPPASVGAVASPPAANNEIVVTSASLPRFLPQPERLPPSPLNADGTHYSSSPLPSPTPHPRFKIPKKSGPERRETWSSNGAPEVSQSGTPFRLRDAQSVGVESKVGTSQRKRRFKVGGLASRLVRTLDLDRSLTSIWLHENSYLVPPVHLQSPYAYHSFDFIASIQTVYGKNEICPQVIWTQCDIYVQGKVSGAAVGWRWCQEMYHGKNNKLLETGQWVAGWGAIDLATPATIDLEGVQGKSQKVMLCWRWMDVVVGSEFFH